MIHVSVGGVESHLFVLCIVNSGENLFGHFGKVSNIQGMSSKDDILSGDHGVVEWHLAEDSCRNLGTV